METQAATDAKHVDQLWRHITEVQRNCYTLGRRLIERGERELGLRLIANSLSHDQTKFHGIEWDYLSVEEGATKAQLGDAVAQHNRSNEHHPEYWNGIQNMPEVYVAEMVADWKTRSSEFGTSLQEWIDKGASVRFGYTRRSRVYRSIMRFTNLLLDSAFT